MTDLIGLSVAIYALAIAISLVVALLIKGIVVALPLLEGRRRQSLAATGSPATTTCSVPPEHVAAITAAIAAAIGEHHILHIEDRGRGVVWTAEGRMMHHTSHAISRRPKR
ncbi:MAG: hypothetical protein ACR2PO_06645 [Methyloligellaceae bacterium]